MRMKNKIFLFFVFLGFLSQAGFAGSAGDLKASIYPNLKCCACQVAFKECTCPEAKQMKGYAEALIDAGMGEAEIYYLLAKRFSLGTIINEEIKTEVEQRLVKEAGQNRPRIVLQNAYLNFGQVSRKQGRITASFDVLNQGNADLVVSDINTHCACTSASLITGKTKSPYFSNLGAGTEWQAIIGPAESGRLEVVIDLNHPHIGRGKVLREVSVFSNDPVYPESVIRLELELVD